MQKQDREDTIESKCWLELHLLWHFVTLSSSSLNNFGFLNPHGEKQSMNTTTT